MNEKKKTNWANILQVIGFLFFIGPILAAFSDPANRVQKVIMSAIGLVMLGWGTVLVYHRRRERRERKERESSTQS
jgi:uncharacterized membrane protein